MRQLSRRRRVARVLAHGLAAEQHGLDGAEAWRLRPGRSRACGRAVPRSKRMVSCGSQSRWAPAPTVSCDRDLRRRRRASGRRARRPGWSGPARAGAGLGRPAHIVAAGQAAGGVDQHRLERSGRGYWAGGSWRSHPGRGWRAACGHRDCVAMRRRRGRAAGGRVAAATSCGLGADFRQMEERPFPGKHGAPSQTNSSNAMLELIVSLTRRDRSSLRERFRRAHVSVQGDFHDVKSLIAPLAVAAVLALGAALPTAASSEALQHPVRTEPADRPARA